MGVEDDKVDGGWQTDPKYFKEKLKDKYISPHLRSQIVVSESSRNNQYSGIRAVATLPLFRFSAIWSVS